MQPYALFQDSRNGTVYRVAADGQSKCVVTGAALAVDQLNLDQHGFDATVNDADNGYLHDWLDSVPRVG